MSTQYMVQVEGVGKVHTCPQWAVSPEAALAGLAGFLRERFPGREFTLTCEGLTVAASQSREVLYWGPLGLVRRRVTTTTPAEALAQVVDIGPKVLDLTLEVDGVAYEAVQTVTFRRVECQDS